MFDFLLFFLPVMKSFINIECLKKGMEEGDIEKGKENNDNSVDKKIDEENQNISDAKKYILIKSAKEYYSSGLDELNKNRFNSAVVLFFKSLVAFIDLYVFQKTGETPSSHTSRFRIAEEKFPEVYNLLDKDFPFYQDSYVQIMTKELAEVIKNDAEIMAGKTKVEL